MQFAFIAIILAILVLIEYFRAARIICTKLEKYYQIHIKYDQTGERPNREDALSMLRKRSAHAYFIVILLYSLLFLSLAR